MSDSTLVGVNRHSNTGPDKNGRDIQLLAFTPEQTQALIESLSNFAETGALIRVATELRTTKDGSRQFPSSFLLVMEDKPRDGAGVPQKKVAFKPKTYGAPVVNKPVAKTAYKPYKPNQTRLIDSGEE